MSDNDEETEEHEDFETQMEVATKTIRAAVLMLLREGEVDPRVILWAAARVTGELGASAALASGQEVEELLGELAEVSRQAGRDQEETLRTEGPPVAGNA